MQTKSLFQCSIDKNDEMNLQREKEENFRSRPTTNNNKPARKNNNLRTKNQPIVVQEPPRTVQENSKPLDIVSQTFSNFPAFQKNSDDSDFR